MTLHEIYHAVIRHLYQQMAISLNRDETIQCAYRGEGGTKCAVGALIPDRYYSPRMEGFQPSDNIVQSALVASGVLDKDESTNVRLYKIRLLTELQTIHDSFYAREDWPWSRTVSKLKERGEQMGLSWPEGVPLA